MADPPKTSAPTFSFASPSTSSAGNLFASAGTSGGNSLFGGTQPAAGGSLFGSSTPATSKPAAGSGVFGSAAATSGPQSNPFNTASSTNTAAAPTFSFGNPGGADKAASGGGSNNSKPFPTFSTPNRNLDAAAAGDTSKPLFGLASNAGTSSTGSTLGAVFGSAGSAGPSAAGMTTPASNKPGGLFTMNNNPSTTPAGPPPAGGSGTSAPSIFGSAKPQQQLSMFGGLNQNSTQASGAPSTTSAAPSPFSSTGTTSNTGLFAQKPQASSTAPSSGLFSTTQSNAPKNPFGSLSASTGTAAPNFLSTSSATTQQSKTEGGQPSQAGLAPGLFSTPGPQKPATNQATSSASSSLFSGNANETSATGSKPSFFSTTAAQPSAATSDAAAATASPFTLGKSISSTAPSAPPASSSSPAPSLFSAFGQADKNKSTPNTSTATSTSLGISSSAAPTSSAPGSLFNAAPLSSTSAAATQGGNQAPAPASAADAPKPATLGASTAGPKPTPQSRLKNKSIDEIITRWASDLSKYQKEFQRQAEKVAEWDRMLVDNSEKIQKLYGSTLEAERATVEVERQLSSVENDQAELEYWLDHYEKQVDELMSNQVGQADSLQGPDQERERTYKLAEKLSDRLEEMGKDLTGMIEEINATSSTLNKNKADDPLSQIVRVLNGHLTQLQQIDQGTAVLQTKLAAAQKESRGVGGLNGFGGPGSDAVDDFYKSYMGRR